jgi:exonuclease SbcC
MRLDYIKLHNFFNHASTEIDFTEVESPTLVTGSNGAGKTSGIVESLTYALFGETRLASIDDAIRNEEEDMSVTVQFHLNGQDVRVTRSKKRGKSQKLKLSVNDVAVEELLSETQQRLNKMIGLSSDTFRSSVLLRQDDSNFFVKAKPDQRKQIIAEILNLSQFERLEKIAKDKRATNKAEIKANQYVLDTIEDIDVEALSGQLNKVNRIICKHETKIENAQTVLDEIREWNTGVNEQLKHQKEIEANNFTVNRKITQAKTDISDKQKELSVCETILSKFKDPTKILQQAQEAIQDLQDKLDEANNSVSDFKVRYTTLISDWVKPIDEAIWKIESEISNKTNEIEGLRSKVRRLKSLTTSECYTCLQPINEHKHQEIIAEYELEFSHLEEECKLHKIEIAKLKTRKEELESGNFEEAIGMRTEAKEISNSIKEYKTDLATAKEFYQKKIKEQKDHAVATERMQFLQQAIDTATESLNFLRTQLKDVPEVNLTLRSEEEAKFTLTELREQYKQCITAKSEIEQTIAKASKDAAKKEKLTTDIANYKKELELLDMLCVAFSKNGIPAAIIETVLPEIQDTANYYLAKMSEGSFELTFSTTETLKNGNEKGTLDVQVFDGNVWRNFESLSGGEQFRVSLSIRLALSKVLSRRAGVELDLLILDEPAAALDPEGREAFCSTIKSLSDSFSRILIMSHIPQLQNEFDSRINLSKSETGTKVL